MTKEGISTHELETQFDGYLQEAHRLKQHYNGTITIWVGLETEFIHSMDLDKLDELLRRYGDRIEYLVGSVHHVNGIPIDFDLPTYKKALQSFPPTSGQSAATEDVQHARMESFLGSYFDAQFQLFQRFHPEVVGHFDLCRLYCPSLRLQNYELAWEKLTRNVQFAISYGALFELNAAALRKGWDGAYPGEDVLQVCRSYFRPSTNV